MPKVALITGINGFLGRNIHEYLNDRGILVVGVPRVLLDDPQELRDYINQFKPHYIYHCAAYGNHSIQRDVDETIITNIIKTYSLLRATQDIDYEVFFNISSSSVYGKKDYIMKENDFLEPDNFYSATKAASEFLARPYAKTLNKNVVNVRPFSLYGPYEKGHRFIPTIIRNLINNTPMELIEPSVHDWIYVEDFIEALEVIRKNISISKGDSINIGTCKQTTNREIYDKVSDLMKLKTKVKPTKTQRDYEPSFWRADITKMRMLGWKPRHSLEQGLWKTVKYFKPLYDSKYHQESLTTIIETTVHQQFGIKFESIR